MRSSVGKVYDAERLTTRWCRPHDRHREHLPASIWTLSLTNHLTLVNRQRMLSAEHPRRDTHWIVNFDRRAPCGSSANRGNDMQRIGRLIVNENRGVSRADGF